jgi:membrane-associated protease RseP (regulator of RpoE activity)
VQVASLAPKYSGKLKAGDRIVALDGRPIENARQFRAMVNAVTQERNAVLMVERGKEKVRIETRWVLPPREKFASARVQAKYIPADKEIQIISRSVAEMRVDVPAHWLPANLYWNGLEIKDLKTPGCLLLKMEKELLHEEKCP